MIVDVFYGRNEDVLSDIDEDDDNLHCSTMSIGGVLWRGDAEDLPKQLKQYNNSQLFEGGRIKCLHMADGSTIYPAA